MTEECSVYIFFLELPSISRYVLTTLGFTMNVFACCDMINAILLSVAFQTKSCVCDRYKWKHEMEAARGCKESSVGVFG